MKFLHAADIHLDSPLCGLSAYPDAPAERNDLDQLRKQLDEMQKRLDKITDKD